ncbi:DUF222 domain-containing protein [Microbacterium elymi]|uniref:DUF222 domain-containing protein n=1 Tax=Microbacterium elymi TaxID=2909587 RepID=UPI003F49AA5B
MDELSAEDLDLPGIDALVTGLVETRRAIARLQAFEASLLSSTVDVVATCAAARGVDDDRDLPWREVSAEIGAALRMSDRTVQARLGEAAVLVTRFPATHTAWADGLLDQSRVRVIVEVGATLPDAQTRTVYEQTVLPRAAELTPGRLRPVCRTVADRVHPDSISTRHKQARQSRTTRVIDLDDDMSRLLLDGPATLIHAIFDRATQMARTVQQAATGPDPDATTTPEHEDGLPVGDDRTLDQLRADVLTDLLLTAAPTGHGPADAFAGITARAPGHHPRHPAPPRLPQRHQHPGPRRSRGPRPGARDPRDPVRVRADRHPHRPHPRRRHHHQLDPDLHRPAHRHPRQRRPVPTPPRPGPTPGRPRPALPLPRLPATRPPVRPGPHPRPRPRRNHRARQPRTPLPPTPRPQTPHPVDRPTTARRNPGMDQPHRPRLPRPPHPNSPLHPRPPPPF